MEHISTTDQPVDNISGSIVDNPQFKNLSLKQQRWVMGVLNGETYAVAARNSGYPERTAAVRGAKLSAQLKHILEPAIKAQQTQLAKATMVNKERWLHELQCLAFYNVQDMIDDEGNPLPLSQLSRNDAAALAAMEVHSNRNGRVKKYRFCEKLKALELIGKAVGFYDEAKENHPLAAVTIDVLLQMKRDVQRKMEDGAIDVTPPKVKGDSV
tara:strand:+ start:1107 stop:1742 length:636 start_codon:yes stop_codon:yes gene_type:complete